MTELYDYTFGASILTPQIRFTHVNRSHEKSEIIPKYII